MICFDKEGILWRLGDSTGIVKYTDVKNVYKKICNFCKKILNMFKR